MGSKRFKYSRYAMYNKIEEFFNQNKADIPTTGDCLLVGDTLRGKGKGTGNTAITDMLPKKIKVIAPPYPDVDIQSMPYDDYSFSYVIADQVLEHVQKPGFAADEVRRVLQFGGIAILTSCLLHPIHGIPDDYWRFTPDGLRVLCESFSYIYQCGGMGNLNMVLDCFKGKRGQRVVRGTPIEERALENDGKNLLHVWIIAQK